MGIVKKTALAPRTVLSGIIVTAACSYVYAVGIALSPEAGKPGAASVLFILGAFFISSAIGWFVGRRCFRMRSEAAAFAERAIHGSK